MVDPADEVGEGVAEFLECGEVVLWSCWDDRAVVVVDQVRREGAGEGVGVVLVPEFEVGVECGPGLFGGGGTDDFAGRGGFLAADDPPRAIDAAAEVAGGPLLVTGARTVL